MKKEKTVKKILILFITCLCCLLAVSSCKKADGVAMQNNLPPVANAGPDQTIALPARSVNLDGSASSDPDNNITSYAWSKISGPSSVNLNASTVQYQMNDLVRGSYLFLLKVTDAAGSFDVDTVQINVIDPPVSGPVNTLFFFRDPTGSLDEANISVIEGFSPQIILAKVRIEGFPDAGIEGVWSRSVTPWCPISSIYFDNTSYGSFNLPPGTYTWTAESVTTNLSRYLIPAGFKYYWATPHNATGSITVEPGATCIIKEIIF